MAQTDRQTDKATHWKTAIFDSGENFSGQYGALDILPSHVKEVHRKKEICPDTGREHYQVHVICHRQVKLKQMTDWIKYTKWFMVLGAEHIKNSLNYIRKVDTTAPGAQVEVIQGEQYLRLSELLKCIARAYIESDLSQGARPLDIQIYMDRHLYKKAARHLVQQDLNWINKLCNPAVEKAWNYFHQEVFQDVWEEEGSFIIEDPSAAILPAECLIE